MRDVLIDMKGARAAALVVERGLLHVERVLPFEEVRLLGKNVVLARRAGSVDADASKGRCPDTHRITTLPYRWVVSRGGQRIGIVDDLYLDETGGITAYAIEHTECGGILRRHCRFAHQERVTLGTDALIVPDAVAEAADLDTRDEREPA